MIAIKYDRDTVCAGDDYVNRDLTIILPDDAILEDLVKYILHYRDGNYSSIPYTGGHAFWDLESDKGLLASLCDEPEEVSYPVFEKETQLKDLNITRVFGKRVS